MERGEAAYRCVFWNQLRPPLVLGCCHTTETPRPPRPAISTQHAGCLRSILRDGGGGRARWGRRRRMGPPGMAAEDVPAREPSSLLPCDGCWKCWQ